MIVFWISSEISSDPKNLFTLFWKPIEDKPTPQTWQFTLVGQGDGSIGEDLAWGPEFDPQNTCKKARFYSQYFYMKRYRQVSVAHWPASFT